MSNEELMRYCFDKVQEKLIKSNIKHIPTREESYIITKQAALMALDIKDRFAEWIAEEAILFHEEGFWTNYKVIVDGEFTMCREPITTNQLFKKFFNEVILKG